MVGNPRRAVLKGRPKLTTPAENLPGQFAVWLASQEADFLKGRFVWSNWDVDELIELKDKVAADPTFLTIGLVQ